MSDLLYPILRRGALDGSMRQEDVLLYAVRDFRGVEPIADTDRTGFNEEAEWTERCEDAYTREHIVDGGLGHRGPKHVIGFVFVKTQVWFNPSTNQFEDVPYITDDSQLFGVSHATTPIGTVKIDPPYARVNKSTCTVTFAPLLGSRIVRSVHRGRSIAYSWPSPQEVAIKIEDWSGNPDIYPFSFCMYGD